MIKFTPTEAGATLIASATAGTNPVIIDSIEFYNGDSKVKTFTEFSGSVYKDDSGIGEYVKIVLEDTSDAAYTATSVTLKCLTTEVAKTATTEHFSVTKASAKGLKLEISCQFDGAAKCSFTNISIALPHATQFREGVIRLARTENEDHKDFTVYSASVVDGKFNDFTADLSGSYVPWDVDGSNDPIPGSITLDNLTISDDIDSPTKTATIIVDSTSGNFVFSKPVTGSSAVASSASFDSSNHVISGASSSDKLVNEKYIDSIYSNAVIVSNAATDKLVSGKAVSDYLNGSDNDFVHKAGAETITGAKTFTESVVISGTGKSLTTPAISSASYTGDGVYTTYADNTWDTSSTQSKIPTVGAVADAIDAVESSITTAYQTADSSLQSQIDGINAGQNLADIVDTKTQLAAHALTDLKAKGDYKSGTSGPTWAVGDKIQVLHDTTTAAGTYDDSTAEKIAAGKATVYELVKGTIDTTTNPKDVAAATTGYYWHYIGEYGTNAYTKGESDDKYVIKANLDTSISSASTNNNAPTSLAVYNYVDSAISTAGGDYVKLTSATTQTIASPLVFKASTNATQTLSIPDGQHITSNNALTIKADNTTTSVTTEYDLTNTAYAIKGGSDTYIDFRKTTVNSTAVADVSGDMVASYRDSSITSGTLTDGRLVTVDYLTHFTGDMSAYAKLASDNTFTGTNTFAGITATSYGGTGVYSTYTAGSGTGGWDNSSNNSLIPTVASVRSAISDAKEDVLDALSETNAVGSIGLFIYSEVGAEKVYGETIDGQYLKPVGLSLPMSGQISYKSVASVPAMSGAWKLLSVAFKRTATEPCLVLAQKVNATYPIPS